MPCPAWSWSVRRCGTIYWPGGSAYQPIWTRPARFVDYVLTGIRDKLQVGFEYTFPLRSVHQNMLSTVMGVASVSIKTYLANYMEAARNKAGAASDFYKYRLYTCNGSLHDIVQDEYKPLPGPSSRKEL